jgi:hypothetical protein
MIFRQPAAKFRQRFFKFSLVLTPANAFHSSFFIFHYDKKAGSIIKMLPAFL